MSVIVYYVLRHFYLKIESYSVFSFDTYIIRIKNKKYGK